MVDVDVTFGNWPAPDEIRPIRSPRPFASLLGVPPDRGYDGAKRITGRKRRIAVDTLGLIVAVVVHGAYWQDHDGACFELMKLRRICPPLKVLFADSAYGRKELPEWVRETFGWVLQVVLRPVGVRGFVVLPKRGGWHALTQEGRG